MTVVTLFLCAALSAPAWADDPGWSVGGASPEDAAAEDASPEDAAAEAASPEDAAAEDASPEDAAAEDASPEDAAAEAASPEALTSPSQGPPAPPPRPLDSYALGEQDGLAAAADLANGRSFLLGFCFGAVAAPCGCLGTTVVQAARPAEPPEGPWMDGDPAYMEGYAEAYQRRARRTRAAATFAGGLAGSAVLTVVLLSL